MKKGILGTLSFVLLMSVAISCGGGGGNPLVKKAKKAVESRNYDEAIAAADEAIAANPDDAAAYLYKAQALGEQASEVPQVSARVPGYQAFRTNLNKAVELNDAALEPMKEVEDGNNIALNLWSFEHNRAIYYATNDSLLQNDPNTYQNAIDHLKNAITINPDSTLSYEVLSEVYRASENYEGAVEYLEKAINLKDNPSADDYDRLGFFYGETLGDYQKAISVLEKGLSVYPDSVGLTQTIANAYFAVGEREKGIQAVENLIQREPNNVQYKLSIGTRLYRSATELGDRITKNNETLFDLDQEKRDASDARVQEIDNEIAEIRADNESTKAQFDLLADRAESELVRAAELDPENYIAHETLAIIYQNKAAALFEERNLERDFDKADEYDRQAKESLKDAVEYYEKSITLTDDAEVKRGLWCTLFPLYVTLDMQDKATDAESNCQE